MSKGTIRALDLFCGAGGSSLGARMAGAEIAAGIDWAPLAVATFADNFPGALALQADIARVRPSTISDALGGIDLLLASPECTNHSCAKGGARRSEKSRLTAFEVLRFARHLKPRWIVVENVIQMRSWHRYGAVLDELAGAGYRVREQILDAADFGVPQSRKRLFLMCDREANPPEVHGTGSTGRPARSFIEPNGAYPFTPVFREGRAERTKLSAARAIAALGPRTPFLIVYYGSDGAGGWQRTSVPLRTITTLDRFALVRTLGGQRKMRMLQVPELQLAMGFPPSYRLCHGVRRDKIMLLGNGVCPPVMREVVRTLTGTSGGQVRCHRNAAGTR